METIGIVAMSLDGCMTRHDREGVGFASSGDREFFRAALAECDCCLMGSQTFEGGRERILQGIEQDRLRLVLTSEPSRYAGFARPDRLEFHTGDLARTIDWLRSRGFRRCAILGGTGIYTEAVARGLMDELWITLEPVAFGTGRRLFDGPNDFRFSLKSVERLGENTLLLKYRAA
jgi:dihydrofolate reductase